ncbi:MAG: relaxase/mobilization nuclease RlxS [Pseudomonadota bacterium]
MSEDDFTPRIGRMRAKGAKRRYLGQVVAAARRAGARTGIRSRRFDGSRIGRGAGLGRVLGSRDRYAHFRSRRAIVKTRLVKLAGKGLGAAKAHLRYIERDGVTREGEPGELYAADRDAADGKAFLGRCGDDRHQFRFIVSVEDADQYTDLKPFVRKWMAQMEEDLGTKLDWVAVDHFNTGHPHSHIMLRGKDDLGENLVIAREYIAHGMRERAAEIVTLDLGPRTDLEIEERLRHDIGEERLTAIDRKLLREMDGQRVVSAGHRDPFQQALRAGRLQKLGGLGLAEDVGAGDWQLDKGMEQSLRELGERGDIIRTMQRELTAARLDCAPANRSIYNPASKEAAPLIGRVVARGLADELRDRHYLIVDGVDGRTHYVGIGKGDAVEPLVEGAIVKVEARTADVRKSDRTIAEVAAANNGRYSLDAHLKHDRNASEEFAQTHVRRLEAMRRMMRSVAREADGSWHITEDHLDKAAAYEVRRMRDRPVTVEMLSRVPLEQLPQADAATWLDQELTAGNAIPIRDVGFGRDVRMATAARKQWLVENGLAGFCKEEVVCQPGMIKTLRRRELMRVASRLSEELGLRFVERKDRGPIEGTLRKKLNMISGSYALVTKSKEFTLLPWRPVLERQIGKVVSGELRGGRVSWTLGRERGGPVIT